jgi:hypothetical protein
VRARRGWPADGNVDPDPARCAVDPAATRFREVGRSRRGVGGGGYRPAGRGPGGAGAACSRAGQWAHLCHFLADPNGWHKIDLVRVRDRKAPGGWRYYAHLLVHRAGYQSSATRVRRAAIPTDRRAGVDANVSNLALASFPDHHPEQLHLDQITCSTEQQQAAARAANKARTRQRALDRSRRNTNPGQYGPSARQHKCAERRAERGLNAKQITNPGGARHARADGVPLRAYRHDNLSGGYHRTRTDHAAQARSISQAKHARARDMAARIVHRHGNTITVEDVTISTWARLWGKRIALFSPGMFVTALARECAATGGRLHRAGTRSTALSQHCLCGVRVPKTLGQRTHQCPQCGLHGDRDIVSAALAACVDLADPDDPAHRARRLPTCPRPTGGAGLPARVGGLSQPAPATSITRCWIGQDRQPPPGGLC